MKTEALFGVAMCAAPFVIITLMMVHQDGLRTAALVWLITFAFIGCIALGSYLLTK